ncbi:DUF423 domain-containing protein [Crocinitomix catalasitica]|uniref:DUF423 domain-containing protein n=1 Tax=Crocinitomix catalasitica TaxID=184607 RepID=UPI0004827B1A|nr:DUF423 domain-containing protein [Crocinitomix catalasitica]
MNKQITITGTILILLSIILGAMAAHSLEKTVSAELIATFEKGVKYQMYIGLGLLVVGLNATHLKFKLNGFFWFNLIGILLFSGGIYTYTFHEMTPGLTNFVHIVPFGGTAMIIGWVLLLIKLIKTQ